MATINPHPHIKPQFPLLLLLLLLLLTSRSSASATPGTTAAFRRCRSQPPLICHVVATRNNKVTGVINFTPVYTWSRTHRGRRCRTRITAHLTRLRPGPHGLHVHIFGDVRASDGTSMAGHFGGGVHGLPRDGRRRHLGDLGNIVANKKGVARYDRIEERWGVGTVLGRGVVVHEKEDVGTQPTGDAGSRIGTCVIGFANPDWKDDTYA